MIICIVYHQFSVNQPTNYLAAATLQALDVSIGESVTV